MSKHHLSNNSRLKSLLKKYSTIFPKLAREFEYSDMEIDLALRDGWLSGYAESIVRGKTIPKDELLIFVRNEPWYAEIELAAQGSTPDAEELKDYLNLYDEILRLCFEIQGYPIPDELTNS